MTNLYKIYLFLLFVNCNYCFITNTNMFSLKTIKTINYKNNILVLKCKNNLNNEIEAINKSILVINMSIYAVNYACGITDISKSSLIILYISLLYLLISKFILINKKNED